MTEFDAPPPLAPESVQLTARPPSLIPALAADRQSQAFVETMPDGTRVLYRTDGMPIRQWNVDGSIVSFDAQGRPQTPMTADGAHQPSSHPVPDGAPKALVMDKPDGQGRPVGVTFPDGTQARYAYEPDGGRVVHYSTGVVTTEDKAGNILAERLPNGTVLTAQGSQGQPIGGAARGGQLPGAQQMVATAAMPSQDGTTVVDPAGKPVRQITADGTVYDQFDAQGRPTSGITPDGSRFTITYDAKGDAFELFADGQPARPAPARRVVQQVAPDGTVFNGMNSNGRPTSGVSPGGGRFTVTYQPKADSTAGATDRPATRSSSGGQALPPAAPDTAAPGSAGRPTSGTLPDGTRYTVTYDAKGDAFQHLSNGTTVEYSPSGKIIKETTPDGTVFDSFDGNGRPTSGTTADGTHFTTTYDAKGDTFQHFSDGTTVEYDGSGHPIKTWTPDGKEITWAVDLPALEAAARTVSAEHDSIQHTSFNLKNLFTMMEGEWKGPAGATLEPLATAFNGISDTLLALLADAVSRMKKAHENYVAAESTNTKNLN
jgi:YD repeat-containing protein